MRVCPVMVISGNTTMVHFLLELDAWTVFSAPYAPVTSNPGFYSGKELEMDFGGQIYFIPVISNYVGGDIVSGLLTVDFYKKEEIGLFFDIGTNGELVIGNKDWLIAGAGAAGPALEGDISKYGIRACDRAIDTVKIYGQDLFFTTIGNKKPKGICGSGIIDLIAEMRLNGWVDISGTLNPEASGRVRYLEEEEQYVAVYAEAEESWDGTPPVLYSDRYFPVYGHKSSGSYNAELSAGKRRLYRSGYQPLLSFRGVLRSWKSGISYYCEDFSGYASGAAYCHQKFFAGRSKDTAFKPEQNGGY